MNYDWSDKTILIAEDEQTNYNYLVAVLENTKAKVIRAKNGEDAVQIIKSNEISLVLMDIRMPELSGYEAILKIKAYNKKMPIVAQTAYAMFDDKDRIVKAGCDDFLAKPIRPALLIETIAKYF
ncbi:MAG TPA: response regulator [Bacteroidales bacterium]|nr:response regulator [Bacteroidales bacterium]